MMTFDREQDLDKKPFDEKTFFANGKIDVPNEPSLGLEMPMEGFGWMGDTRIRFTFGARATITSYDSNVPKSPKSDHLKQEGFLRPNYDVSQATHDFISSVHDQIISEKSSPLVSKNDKQTEIEMKERSFSAEGTVETAGNLLSIDGIGYVVTKDIQFTFKGTAEPLQPPRFAFLSNTHQAPSQSPTEVEIHAEVSGNPMRMVRLNLLENRHIVSTTTTDHQKLVTHEPSNSTTPKPIVSDQSNRPNTTSALYTVDQSTCIGINGDAEQSTPKIFFDKSPKSDEQLDLLQAFRASEADEIKRGPFCCSPRPSKWSGTGTRPRQRAAWEKSESEYGYNAQALNELGKEYDVSNLLSTRPPPSVQSKHTETIVPVGSDTKQPSLSSNEPLFDSFIDDPDSEIPDIVMWEERAFIKNNEKTSGTDNILHLMDSSVRGQPKSRKSDYKKESSPTPAGSRKENSFNFAPFIFHQQSPTISPPEAPRPQTIDNPKAHFAKIQRQKPPEKIDQKPNTDTQQNVYSYSSDLFDDASQPNSEDELQKSPPSALRKLTDFIRKSIADRETASIKSDLVPQKTDPPKSHCRKTDPAKSHCRKTDPAKSDSSRRQTDPTKSDSLRPKTDSTKSDDSSARSQFQPMTHLPPNRYSACEKNIPSPNIISVKKTTPKFQEKSPATKAGCYSNPWATTKCQETVSLADEINRHENMVKAKKFQPAEFSHSPKSSENDTDDIPEHVICQETAFNRNKKIGMEGSGKNQTLEKMCGQKPKNIIRDSTCTYSTDLLDDVSPANSEDESSQPSPSSSAIQRLTELLGKSTAQPSTHSNKQQSGPSFIQKKKRIVELRKYGTDCRNKAEKALRDSHQPSLPDEHHRIQDDNSKDRSKDSLHHLLYDSPHFHTCNSSCHCSQPLESEEFGISPYESKGSLYCLLYDSLPFHSRNSLCRREHLDESDGLESPYESDGGVVVPLETIPKKVAEPAESLTMITTIPIDDRQPAAQEAAKQDFNLQPKQGDNSTINCQSSSHSCNLRPWIVPDSPMHWNNDSSISSSGSSDKNQSSDQKPHEKSHNDGKDKRSNLYALLKKVNRERNQGTKADPHFFTSNSTNDGFGIAATTTDSRSNGPPFSTFEALTTPTTTDSTPSTNGHPFEKRGSRKNRSRRRSTRRPSAVSNTSSSKCSSKTSSSIESSSSTCPTYGRCRMSFSFQHNDPSTRGELGSAERAIEEDNRTIELPPTMPEKVDASCSKNYPNQNFRSISMFVTADEVAQEEEC